MQTNIQWENIIFTEQWLNNLDRITARRFGEGGLAEEASSYVMECLSNDNWSVLQAFTGKSKPETYLHTVTLNLIEEFSRKRFGRPRPPEWLKRQGNFWVNIWKLICLERQVTQSVIDRLKEIRDTLYIKDVIRTIKARLPWCGESAREVQTSAMDFDDNNPIEFLIPDSNTPHDQLKAAHHAELLLMINCLLTEQKMEDTMDKVSREFTMISDKFEKFRQNIELSDEERLILKMVYQDGINKSVVAKLLGMQTHIPGRILKRVFSKIADAMGHAGFQLDDIVFETA